MSCSIKIEDDTVFKELKTLKLHLGWSFPKHYLWAGWRLSSKCWSSGKCWSIHKFISLFLVVLGLRCCTRAFSGCSQRASRCGGFPCCRAQALGTRAFSGCSQRASRCGGFPCCRAQALGTRVALVQVQLLWFPGPRACRLQELRCTGSEVVAHGL